MSTETPRPFIDSDGQERVPTQWGFNSFRTADGAKKSVRVLGRIDSQWYIWRLADGTFDYTASGCPDIPGHPAALVERVRIAPMRRLVSAPEGEQ